MKRVLVLLSVALVAATYEIVEEDKCSLPPCEGKGKGSKTRWYYNIENEKCQTFKYRGSGGNKNNFLTECDCQKSCEDNTDKCSLPPCKGTGKAKLTRWYYDIEKGKCQTFTYGGSGGNKNNFQTKCDCQKSCGDNTDKCSLPPCEGDGTCSKSYVTRWYYNIENEKCQTFNYSGTGGNKNNFQTKCDCQNSCGDNTDICCQPKEEGTGCKKIHRWYYNNKKNKCERFTYGGSGGNQNNFKKKCECEAMCL